MSDAQNPEAIFRGILDALERNDAEAALDFFVEDSVVVDYTNPTVQHKGRAAIAEVIRSLLESLQGLKFEVVDFVASEDRLTAEVISRATPAGQTEPWEMQYGIAYKFRDGKIISEHIYMDSGQFPTEG